MTTPYMELRVCERFGIRPWELEEASAGWRKLLMANEVLRQTEEMREVKALMGVGSGA